MAKNEIPKISDFQSLGLCDGFAKVKCQCEYIEMCKRCAWVHGEHIVDPWEDAAAAAGSDITSVCPELSLAASPARPRLPVESAGCFALLCSDLQSLLAGWAAAGLAWAGAGLVRGCLAD